MPCVDSESEGYQNIGKPVILYCIKYGLKSGTKKVLLLEVTSTSIASTKPYCQMKALELKKIVMESQDS